MSTPTGTSTGFGVENMHTDWAPAMSRLKAAAEEFTAKMRAAAATVQNDLPTHPAVHQGFEQIAQATARVPEMVDQANALYRKVHAEDIARGETPRTNEKAWNVK